MTAEQIGVAIGGAFAVIGSVIVVMIGIWNKYFKKDTTPTVASCPVPDCRDGVIADVKGVCDSVHGMNEKVLVLEQGQILVREQLEKKRLQIQLLITDSTEIKTDVKWIVRELRRRNDK